MWRLRTEHGSPDCNEERKKTVSYTHLDVYKRQILMFNNDSIEAGDRLRETLRPETIRIRKKIWKLLEDLYSYKQL